MQKFKDNQIRLNKTLWAHQHAARTGKALAYMLNVLEFQAILGINKCCYRRSGKLYRLPPEKENTVHSEKSM